MISISRLIRTAALLALAFLNVVPAFAQGSASLLTGTVKDVNGGVLPGVMVKVTNVATNSSVDAVTDGEGVYRAAALATGTYRTDYYDLLSAAPGNSGLYVGQPGDQRTVGVTLRLSFKR